MLASRSTQYCPSRHVEGHMLQAREASLSWPKRSSRVLMLFLFDPKMYIMMIPSYVVSPRNIFGPEL
jgi:hypothetical protein